MAPICSSLSTFPVAFQSSLDSCPWPLWEDDLAFSLPVCRKGLFLQDSIFQYVYEAFENAVREILQRWGVTDLLWEQWEDPKRRLSDALSRYRRLRTHNLKEEDQAVTVTSNGTSFKIVMDVHDFVEGEVKVKVSGERELVVEGRTETKDGDWSVSSNTFRRRFCLPANTDTATVSAVLSDDGILTVTAPRMEVSFGPKMVLPFNTNDNEPSMGGWCGPCPPQWPPSIPTPLRHPRVSQLMGRKVDRCNTTFVNPGSRNFSDPVYDVSVLPIRQMGPFFSDPFFQDTWLDFKEAMREVVAKWGDLECSPNPLAQYRALRRGDGREGKQAVRWAENELAHKLVLDVQDFTSTGDVSVQFLSEREVVVEGRVEDEGTCSRSCRRFQRRFVLPNPVDLQAVSSVVSADGVLTVTAPKQKLGGVQTLSAPQEVAPMFLPGVFEEPIPTHRPPPAPRRAATEPTPRVDSPTPSVQSTDSCDYAGRLYTFSPPPRGGSLTIEEVE